MGKKVQLGRDNTKSQPPKEERSEETNNKSIELLQEINELKLEKTSLSSKVEEYSGYVELYKQQLATRDTKVLELESERKGLYAQIIKTQVSKNTYQILFFTIV